MTLTQKEIDAFNQVKASVANLRTEYDAVCADILETERQLKELPLLPVPPEDLKAAIIDMVEASGAGYRAAIKRQIVAIATNEKSGFSVGSKEFELLLGKPLRFAEINSTLYGGVSSGNVSYQNMLTGGNIGLVDTAIFAVAGGLVKVMLASVMEELTAEDMGYRSMEPNQIGTDRATRRAMIKAAQDRLTTLCESKFKLALSLGQLGIVVASK